MDNNTFWNDDKVIDFVNWYIELHKLNFNYTLENISIVESFKNGDKASDWHISEKQQISKMDEFLDKVDKLCWEYGYEIHPNEKGWTGKVNENGEYDTIAIIGENEIAKVTFIDGDGRGK